MMIPSDPRREQLESLSGDRHEIRDAGQIPIGIRESCVTDVGRERRHGVVEISAVLMPKLNTATDESVAQVVDAHFAMAASCTPTEVASKLPENPLDRPLEDEAARGGPEQWRVSSGRAMTRPIRQVTLQRRHNGGVQWHVPGLAELRVPNRQDSLVEIQIAAVQMERFRQAQTGGGDQPEDRRVSGRPQSALGRKAPGGRKKVVGLLLRIDVRRKAAA